MPQAFLSRNRARMGSNYLTDANQGGGDKKAGFPYQIGRIYTVSNKIGIDPSSRNSAGCCKLANWNTTVFPLARQSRGVGSLYNSNYRYNHIPGTKQ